MTAESADAIVETVVWWVVRGESRFSTGVEPGWAGVVVPDDISDWAEQHGLQDSEPDVYLLVAPSDEADVEVIGEVARQRGPLPTSAVALIREAMAERSAQM